MIDDNLQFAISQYADGTLEPAERAAVEQLLAHDGEARQTLDEYRRLNTLMAASAGPLPDVDWNSLTETISRAIDRSGAVPGIAAAQEAAATVSSYRLGWLRRQAVWAMAASVVLTTGIAWMLLRPGGNAAQAPGIAMQPANTAVEAVRIAQVHVLQVESAGGPAVSEVTIGPSQSITAASVWELHPDLANRPASVSIAGGLRQLARDEPYAAQ